MDCMDWLNGSHFILQTSKFLFINVTTITLGQGHQKVIQYSLVRRREQSKTRNLSSDIIPLFLWNMNLAGPDFILSGVWTYRGECFIVYVENFYSKKWFYELEKWDPVWNSSRPEG